MSESRTPRGESIDILVLGDSALSSLGSTHFTALDFFVESGGYDRRVRFVNPSVAGMTSADAMVYERELSKRFDFDAVVLYLGNCDASG